MKLILLSLSLLSLTSGFSCQGHHTIRMWITIDYALYDGLTCCEDGIRQIHEIAHGMNRLLMEANLNLQIMRVSWCKSPDGNISSIDDYFIKSLPDCLSKPGSTGVFSQVWTGKSLAKSNDQHFRADFNFTRCDDQHKSLIAFVDEEGKPRNKSHIIHDAVRSLLLNLGIPKSNCPVVHSWELAQGCKQVDFTKQGLMKCLQPSHASKSYFPVCGNGLIELWEREANEVIETGCDKIDLKSLDHPLAFEPSHVKTNMSRQHEHRNTNAPAAAAVNGKEFDTATWIIWGAVIGLVFIAVIVFGIYCTVSRRKEKNNTTSILSDTTSTTVPSSNESSKAVKPESDVKRAGKTASKAVTT